MRSQGRLGDYQGLKSRFSEWYVRKTQGVSSNVRLLLATEPLWAIPITWARTYASLFMAALGLSPTQIGWVTSILSGTQLVTAPLGGFVADRFGRKRTLIVFDILSWIMPLIIWMLAQNMWFFAVAAVLNGLNMIIYPTWNCLLVEDTTSEKRASVFAAFQLIVLGAGVFSPMAGWIVTRFGVELGTRIIYFLGLVSISSMVLTRAMRLQETSVGVALVQELRGTSMRRFLGGYRQILAEAARSPHLVLLFLLSTINLAYVTIWTAYHALYLASERGADLAPGVVALWPTFSAVVMILVLVLIVPRVRPQNLSEWLVTSCLVLFGGLLLVALAPAHAYFILVPGGILLAAGTALTNPVRDTVLAELIEDRRRAAVLAAMNSLGMVLVLPLTPLAGRLFEVSPRLLLALLAILLGCAVVIALVLRSLSVAPADPDTFDVPSV